MQTIEEIVSAITYILDSKTKRHVVGGTLLSVSFLFGGLALTVMTINKEKEE